MPRGSFTMFQETQLRLMLGELDLSGDTLTVAICDDTITPEADQTTPTWSDFSANEVTDAGNYTAGGEPLTTVVAAMVAGVATLTADDVNIGIHASGFLDGSWAFLVDTAAAGTPVLGFMELESAGQPVSEQAADVDFEFPAGVVMKQPANALTWETPV
jgi:hypothetical protein